MKRLKKMEVINMNKQHFKEFMETCLYCQNKTYCTNKNNPNKIGYRKRALCKIKDCPLLKK